MVLEVIRHRRNQPAAIIAHDQMQRIPACVASDRLASLKSCQKGVAYKGIFGAGNTVPFSGGDAADVVA